MGESKINILRQFPEGSIPETLFLKSGISESEVLSAIKNAGISFPIILKPNVGERGFLVTKAENETDLSEYLAKVTVDFLVQEFVDEPLEISVMYHRFPDQDNGKVTSICVKKNLEVIGNGKDHVEALMEKDTRAFLQLERFRRGKT